MRNIIDNLSESISENIKSLFSVTRQHHTPACKRQQVECNYANNYYGDQACQQKDME